MKRTNSLLGLIFPRAKQKRLNELLEAFIAYASWLDTVLHLFVPDDLIPRLQEALQRRSKTDHHGPIIIHSIGKDFVSEVLSGIKTFSGEYLCFEDGEIGGERTGSARLKQELIEAVQIPILLLPSRLSLESRRFKTLVVPISGEQRSSTAVPNSLKIAEVTDTSIMLIHVTQAGKRCSCQACGLECVSDQVQHEYAHYLDKIVSAASPKSSTRERSRVTQMVHLSGQVAETVSSFMKHVPRGILVLEWKGPLLQGHAQTLKALLKSAKFPVLIVKAATESHSKLKMGPAFKAA
jgi:hypothetical protein